MTTESPTIDPTWWDRLTQLDDAFDGLLAVLTNLQMSLRPLSGHLNVHSLPSDRIAVQTYALVPGANPPMTVQAGLPKGVAARITIMPPPIGKVYLTTQPAADVANSYIVSNPLGMPLTLQTRSDLYVWATMPSTPGDYPLPIAIESFDATA